MNPDQYAVMGNPISHSQSPRIHTLFAAQTEQALEYRAIHVEIDDFPTAVARFAAAGGKGLNITVPFKQEAWALASQCSPRAAWARAVNTLVIDPAGCHQGDNTDGVGLVRDLRLNLNITLLDQRILLLGAGGAARGVIAPLLEEQPASLVVANRTVARAQTLVEDLGAPLGLSSASLADTADGQFDIIINATAAGLQNAIPNLPTGVLRPGGLCYDMMYARLPTAFMRWGNTQNAGRCVDGLGMLVEQAAESFWIWRGVRPLTPPVIEALRASL